MILVPRDTVWPGQVPTSTNGERRPVLKASRPYLTVHYTGAGAWLDPDDTPTELQAIQRYALGAGKPWEYNYVIDGQGIVWEYAGRYRAAHCHDYNEQAYGVLMLVGVNEPATDPMVLACRELRAWLTSAGAIAAGHLMLQHRQMPGAATACPGSKIVARWPELTDPLPVEDPDMCQRHTIYIAATDRPGEYLWTPGSDPIAFTDPEQRDLLLAAFGIDPLDGVTLSGDMFDRLH